MMTTAITTIILGTLALVWAIREFNRALEWQRERDRAYTRLGEVLEGRQLPLPVEPLMTAPDVTAEDLEEWRTGRWD